jgi:hypothetical protein
MPTYSYHFNVGNSTTGSIGYCARIEAESKAAAVERLRELLPEAVEDVGPCGELGAHEYIHVYFNYETQPTVDDIDEIEDAEGNYLNEGEYFEDENFEEEEEEEEAAAAATVSLADLVAGILGVRRAE